MKKNISVTYRVLCLVIAFSLHAETGKEKPMLFSTTDIFEVDKCASIWLIKNYIDPAAEFLFYPQGAAIDKGILFDVPEAKFRRYAQISTFGYFLRYYKLDNPELLYLARIVHDIEINTWGEKRFPQSLKMEDDILAIIAKAKTTDEVVAASCRYFGDVVAGFKEETTD